jgi:hypothetical protein
VADDAGGPVELTHAAESSAVSRTDAEVGARPRIRIVPLDIKRIPSATDFHETNSYTVDWS